jgi:exodeoxyribonuclease VII small subunit
MAAKPEADVTKKEEISRLSFEEALRRLETVVERLEAADLPLEEALALFEEGQNLAAHCQQKLDEAEKRIEVITTRANGEITISRWSPNREEDRP